MLRNATTGRCGPAKPTASRQHSQVWSCAILAGEKLAPPSLDQETARAAPGYGPCLRAAAALRLSSQATNSSPLGSIASVSNRWLVASSVIGPGAAKLAPPSTERAT